SRPTFHQQDILRVGQLAGQTASGGTTDILTVTRGCQESSGVPQLNFAAEHLRPFTVCRL
ncbi:hypothetical protein ACWERW_41790, partial [Streptomyces sp. NPDC004012]